MFVAIVKPRFLAIAVPIFATRLDFRFIPARCSPLVLNPTSVTTLDISRLKIRFPVGLWVVVPRCATDRFSLSMRILHRATIHCLPMAAKRRVGSTPVRRFHFNTLTFVITKVISMKTDRNLKINTLSMAVAAILGGVSADSMADTVAAIGGPTMTKAANGVPVVDIVAPNSNGLSHNRYTQFNVDAQGLILNNSTEAAMSQLGGAVTANANLSGKSASIILNEVTAANRSTLAGFIEVHGKSAEVVIANPYGITCNGCGFINTPRATLTTGTPNIDAAGILTGFSVRSGDIAIQGVGLDATRQNYFDILSRSMSIVGQLNAKDLQVVAGSYDFNYATRTATAVAATGTAPTVSIDSSQLGGMYADRIRLIATEHGVGVRLLGNVAASVDDVTLSSAGKLQLQNKVNAQRDVIVTYTGAAAADAIEMTNATLAAKHDLNVTAGAGGVLLTGGVLSADNNAAITSASLTDSGASTDVRFAVHQMNMNTGNTSINGTTWNGGDSLQLSASNLTVGANGAAFTSAINGVANGSVGLTSANTMSLGNAQIVSGTTTQLSSTAGAVTLGSGCKGSIERRGENRRCYNHRQQWTSDRCR